jgi:hypothetical protein
MLLNESSVQTERDSLNSRVYPLLYEDDGLPQNAASAGVAQFSQFDNDFTVQTTEARNEFEADIAISVLIIWENTKYKIFASQVWLYSRSHG